MAGRRKKKKEEKRKEEKTKTQGPPGPYVCSSFIVLVEWDYFLFSLSLLSESFLHTSHKMHE